MSQMHQNSIPGVCLSVPPSVRVLDGGWHNYTWCTFVFAL